MPELDEVITSRNVRFDENLFYDPSEQRLDIKVAERMAKEVETPEPTTYPTLLDLIQESDTPVEDPIAVAWPPCETVEPDAPGEHPGTAPSESGQAMEVTG